MARRHAIGRCKTTGLVAQELRFMTKIPKGGTKMWCDKCKKETTCAVIPLYPHSRETGQRKVTKAGSDIHWFERLRKCKICGERFETVELRIDYLYELGKLRDLLRRIRDEADTITTKAAGITADADALIKWQETP